MKTKSESLVDIARRTSKRKPKKPVGEQEVNLLLEFLDQRVTLRGVAAALGVKESCVYATLIDIIRRGESSGMLKVEKL